MNVIKRLSILAFLFIPSTSWALTTTWQSPSTSAGYVFPTTINGVNQNLQVPTLGSSGNPCIDITNTSGLFGTTTCGGGGGSSFSTNPFTATYFVATSTIATSTFPMVNITNGLYLGSGYVNSSAFYNGLNCSQINPFGCINFYDAANDIFYNITAMDGILQVNSPVVDLETDQLDIKNKASIHGDGSSNFTSVSNSGCYFDSSLSCGTSGQVLESTSTGTKWVNASSTTGSVGAVTQIQLSGGGGLFAASSNFTFATTTNLLTVNGNQTTSGYLRVGSNSAPVNTTAGDLTATRFSLGNGTFGNAGEFINAVGTDLTTTTASVSGFSFQTTMNPGADAAPTFRGIYGSNLYNTTANYTGLGTAAQQAIWAENRITNVGNTQETHGITAAGFWIPSAAATMGTASETDAVYAIPVNDFGNAITPTIIKATGVRVANSSKGTSSITGEAGVAIDAQTAGTNNTGLLMGQTAIPTGNYGVYDASVNSNYFAGNVGIASTSPGNTLSVTGTGYFSGLLTAPMQDLGTGGQFINVKAYGAKGDGVTDDTAAINAAIAVQQNGTGASVSTVYFPTGTYLYNGTASSTVTNHPLVIQGYNSYPSSRTGAGTTATLVETATNTPLIQLKDTKSHISNIALTAQQYQDSSEASSTAILFTSGTSYNMIENVSMSNFGYCMYADEQGFTSSTGSNDTFQDSINNIYCQSYSISGIYFLGGSVSNWGQIYVQNFSPTNPQPVVTITGATYSGTLLTLTGTIPSWWQVGFQVAVSGLTGSPSLNQSYFLASVSPTTVTMNTLTALGTTVGFTGSSKITDKDGFSTGPDVVIKNENSIAALDIEHNIITTDNTPHLNIGLAGGNGVQSIGLLHMEAEYSTSTKPNSLILACAPSNISAFSLVNSGFQPGTTNYLVQTCTGNFAKMNIGEFSPQDIYHVGSTWTFASTTAPVQSPYITLGQVASSTNEISIAGGAPTFDSYGHTYGYLISQYSDKDCENSGCHSLNGFNLGIGTTTAGTALSVVGTTTTSGLIISNLASTALGVDANGNVIPSTNSGIVNSGTAGQAAFYSSSGTTLSGTSTLFFSNGLVGINDIAPTHTLDITGNQTLSGYMTIRNNSTPNNTLAGDLTINRLSLNNGVLSPAGQGGSEFAIFSGTMVDSSSTAPTAYQFSTTINPNNSTSTSAFRTVAIEATYATTASSSGSGSSGQNNLWLDNRINTHGGFQQLNGIADTGLIMGSAATYLGTSTEVDAAYFQPISSFSNPATTTFTKAVGLHVVGSSLNGTQILTGQAGLEVDSLTAATNNTSLLIGQTTVPTGNFGIYNASANNNYDNGSLGLGSTTPDSRLSIQAISTLGLTNPILEIASSSVTGTATTTLFQILGNGAIISNANPLATSTFAENVQIATSGVQYAPALEIGPASLTAGIYGDGSGGLCLTSKNSTVVSGGIFCVSQFGNSSTGRLTVNGGSNSANGIGIAAATAGLNDDWGFNGITFSTNSIDRAAFNSSTGYFGWGTTTPAAPISIQAIPTNAASVSLFIIASSSVTNTATSTLMQVLGNGSLLFNGSAGTAGQVLQSNGATSPTWVNAPTIATSTNFIGAAAAQTINSLVSGNATSSVEVIGYVKVRSVTVDVAQFQVTFTDEGGASQTFAGPSLSTTGYNPIAVGQLRVAPNSTVTCQVALTTGTGSILYDTGCTIKNISNN